MRKHITMEILEKAGSFDKAAEPGDTVDEEIAMHFLNCVPPTSQTAGYIQCGEPFDHIYDDEKGRYRATYATFAMVSGKWVYCGNCFKGETFPQGGKGDPWAD